MKILIAYASNTGNTEKLAHAIEEGAGRVEGIETIVKRARDVNRDEAIDVHGYAFGSFSAFEYMAGELKTLFEKLYSVRSKMSGKPALVFTTGKGGQVAALESIDRVIGFFNPRWVKPGIAVEGSPNEEDRKRAHEMGKRLAETVKKRTS